jgi:hypothetical protein
MYSVALNATEGCSSSSYGKDQKAVTRLVLTLQDALHYRILIQYMQINPSLMYIREESLKGYV